MVGAPVGSSPERISPVSIDVSSAMTRLFRILGGLLGLGFLIVGALLVSQSAGGDLVAGISLLFGGAYFSSYAITGRKNLYLRKH